MLHYMIDVKLFLWPQLLRSREQDITCIMCWKFNCFFGLSFYVTGNRLLLVLCVGNSTVSSASGSTLQGTDCCFYYVLEIQLFLRPQLLRYREHTVAGIMCWKFNCFFGLRFYVTGNRLLLLLRVRNSTVSSASAPALQGTDCSCTPCSKFNYFFGLSSYVTGNRLLFYYVFELQLFLRPHCILNHPLSVGPAARKYVLAPPCIFVTSGQPSVTVP